MRINIFKTSAPLLAALCLALTACDDWTDNESVTLRQPDITRENPALYEEYLRALRAYKASEAHNPVYLWFDNGEKSPYSRLHHINALPDSVDVIDLIHPDNLADWELEEIAEVRLEKGTKVTYTIDYDAIRSIYDTRSLEAANAGLTMEKPFNDFLVDTLQTALSFAKKYDYDGICVAYNGKNPLSMSDEEMREHRLNEAAFMGIVDDWSTRNADRTLTLRTNPQYLHDLSIVSRCAKVLIPCDDASDADAFTLYVEQAAVDPDVISKLGVFVTGPKAVDPNKEVGYMLDGRTRLLGLAEWFPRRHAVDATAVGVYNPAGDFYSTTRIYNDTRTLISTINPPLK
ncbi:MAG: glycoside hydrolase family 18 [Mediterranea sp.]|jgi:hypothetical protein|nr:glycoside hydrolase family 18 [Mediterranea sp.]